MIRVLRQEIKEMEIYGRGTKIYWGIKISLLFLM